MLAEKGVGLTRPNPPVGAVVVRDGQVVGVDHQRRAEFGGGGDEGIGGGTTQLIGAAQNDVPDQTLH